MRAAVSVLWGGIVGALLVVVSGMLSIRASGLLNGGVYEISNDLIVVQPPVLPILTFLGIVLCAAVALLCVEFLSSRIGFLSPAASRIGCLVVLTGLIGWSAFITHEVYIEAAVREPPRAWLEGWVQYGGMESSVHLVGVLLLLTTVTGGLWARRRRTPRVNRQA